MTIKKNAVHKYIGNKYTIYNLEYKLVIISSIASTLCFLFYWVYSNILLGYIGLALITISILFLNLKYSMIMYYFMLPNIAIFKFGIDSFAIMSLMIIIMFIKAILNKNFRCRFSYTCIVIFYLIVSFLSYIIADTNLSIMAQEVRVALDMILMLAIIYIFKDSIKEVVNYISNAFVWGTVTASITAFLYQYIFQMSGYERLQSVNGDPNYFALCIALSISLIILKIIYKEYRLIYPLVIVVLFVFGLLSYSRGFIFSMIPNILILIYLYGASKKLKTNFKVLTLLLFLLLIVINYEFSTTITNEYYLRFTVDEYSGGSGRVDIWAYYLHNHLSSLKNILIGTGTETLYVPGWGYKVQHNIYLQLITGKGLIGTITVIMIYWNLFKLIKVSLNVKHYNTINMLPIITCAIAFMFLNGLTADIGIMTIVLSFYISNVYASGIYFK